MGCKIGKLKKINGKIGGKNLIFENMVVKFENLENVTGKQVTKLKNLKN